ncbi:MAG: septum formation inhibitor Maf [Syntrophomonadaceae bacterium]|nr:septum formation inhibitor Maf [Syntrophomonadaceae bacterium]
MQLVLASASPRRAELLKKIGLDFIVRPAVTAEIIKPHLDLLEQVKGLALQKALAVAETLPAGLVIGADTIVVLGQEVLGKPDSREMAVQMLSRLSGQQHQVLTGVALVDSQSGQALSEVESTLVQFRTLTLEEITAYVNTGEPLDKAGAYGIQEKGAILVERIEGCYFNVVGLPLARLVRMLKQMGIEVHQSWR